MKLTVENFLMIVQELELAAVENQNFSPQRHRDTEKISGWSFSFRFLCASVSLW